MKAARIDTAEEVGGFGHLALPVARIVAAAEHLRGLGSCPRDFKVLAERHLPIPHAKCGVIKPVDYSGLVVVVMCSDWLPDRGQIAEQTRLTERQLDVALLLARRFTDKEIAKQLGIKRRTVARHTEAVFLKLGVGSRREVKEVLRGLCPHGDQT